MIQPDLSFEQKYSGSIVGIDEAGRGPWAGPVVAAAVNLRLDSAKEFYKVDGINDSKKLSAKKREFLCGLIYDNCDVGVGIVDVADIDELNILGATKKAMVLAVSNLKNKVDVALIDGNQPPEMSCEVVSIIKGDQKSLSIAAASIIAKVTRDKIMTDLHDHFPHYSWNSNAGYGTAAHQLGLADFGVTPHHRKSFAPIKKLLLAAS